VGVDIICTIGPASNDPKILQELIENGMTVARINMSHGDHRFHQEVIRQVREVSHRLGKEVRILGDLQGPKIRLGEIAGGEIELRQGQTFLLHTQPMIGNQHEASVNYPGIVEDVAPGKRILINDGQVELQARRIARDFIETMVISGGPIASHKGVNLPGTPVRLPALSEKDREDLRFLLLEKVDEIGCSFVRTAVHVEEIRSETGFARGHGPRLIAKIETMEALRNFSGIMMAADGIMIARGDLGVEIPFTWVPLVQKAMIRECAREKVYVITATQMLQSMTERPKPTRAEVTDIFQAVLDGTNAVMLSAESASGPYPVESVHTMTSITAFADRVAAEQPYDLADLLDLLAGNIPVPVAQ